MAIPAIAFAMGTTFMQLLMARLFLIAVGAGFVIGIKMVAQWFTPKYIERAEGFYAGWGNLGSAFAAMTLPWFAITFLGDWLGLGDSGWRWARVQECPLNLTSSSRFRSERGRVRMPAWEDVFTHE